MENILKIITNVTLLGVIIRLILALVLGSIIGIERSRHGRAAGMRTHSLVCLGAVLTVVVGIYAADIAGYNTDPLRICAQVISGIGFLGAGTILLKGHFEITGLTTAAGLWATAAVGLTIGIGYYAVAIIAAMLIFAVNALLTKTEEKILQKQKIGYIYSEINDVNKVNDFDELFRKNYGGEHMEITPAKSGITGHVGIEIELPNYSNEEINRICQKLVEKEFIAFAVEQK